MKALSARLPLLVRPLEELRRRLEVERLRPWTDFVAACFSLVAERVMMLGWCVLWPLVRITKEGES